MFPLNQSLRELIKSEAFSPAALNWTVNQLEGADVGRFETLNKANTRNFVILQDCRHPLLFPIDSTTDVLPVDETASYLHRYQTDERHVSPNVCTQSNQSSPQFNSVYLRKKWPHL